MIELIDTHCHLDFPAFAADRAQIMCEARARGVTRVLIPSVTPALLARAAAVAAPVAGPQVALAAGLHPWWMAEYVDIHGDASLTTLRRELQAALTQPRVCALGETGLDGAIALPLAQQMPLLAAQFEIACAADLPLILHSRRAHAPLLQLIKHHAQGALGHRVRGVIHGFSGSYEQARDFYRANFLLGVGGVMTYARANKTRDALARMPLSALVLETDAPDMPVAGAQGQRNHPGAVQQVAASLAALRAESIEEIAAATSANACKLFGWSPSAAAMIDRD